MEEDLKKNIINKTIELRHELHMHPELSGCETETKRRLMDFIIHNTGCSYMEEQLAKHKLGSAAEYAVEHVAEYTAEFTAAYMAEQAPEYTPETSVIDPTANKMTIYDRGKWFYVYIPAGTAASPPTLAPVALRADMDALPMYEGDACGDLPYASVNQGVSHKCGHDGHAAILAGFAVYLYKLITNNHQIYRDIYLIFQHAEETGAGGAECAELIKEKGISEVYAFHNWSGFSERAIVCCPGTIMCASMGLTLHFTGAPAHASMPENGINPSFTISELINYLESLAGAGRINNPFRDFNGMTLATIVNVDIGSKNFGIAASEGELSVTLRAEHTEDLDKLKAMLLSYADELSETYGLSCTACEADVFPDTSCSAESARKVQAAAGRLKLQYIDLKKPIRSSEDFGWYIKKCEGALFFIGNGVDYPPVHSERYDFNDDIIETALDMFLELATSM